MQHNLQGDKMRDQNARTHTRIPSVNTNYIVKFYYEEKLTNSYDNKLAEDIYI